MTIIETTAPTERRRHSRRASGGGRPPARRTAALAPMGLEELRAYRQELITEESRVSYWRRILQARLDLGLRDKYSIGRLRGVLSEHQESSRRLAMRPLDTHVELPPLPDLTVLWDTETEDGLDPAMVVRLAAAERELSAYRRSLHERLDAATGELIARYRDEPSLALHALPRKRTGAAD